MRRILISGLVAVAAVLGGAAVPAAAMAQPTGAGHLGELARPADTGGFAGGTPMISCVLATDCLGIEGGSSLSSAGKSAPLRIARWNGRSWKGVGVALPKGTKSVDLNGVSCRGAKSCLVVGDYYTSTKESATVHPLALTYNGSSLKPTPAVPLAKDEPSFALSSVSCATTRYCVAIGEWMGSAPLSSGNSLPPIETWNGAKWTLRSIATPAGVTANISGVSCATATFCAFTGSSYVQGSSSFSMDLYFAVWNGKKLRTMTSPTVGGSSNVVEPLGISCATPSNCAATAVNMRLNGSGDTTGLAALTEIWNGKAWQLSKVTMPAATAASVTAGVSCDGARSCETVGAGATNFNSLSFDPVAVSYHGTASTVQAVPAPSKGRSAELTDVSCLPWGTCVAVGETGKTSASKLATMTGVWNGKAWKLEPGF